MELLIPFSFPIPLSHIIVSIYWFLVMAKGGVGVGGMRERAASTWIWMSCWGRSVTQDQHAQFWFSAHLKPVKEIAQVKSDGQVCKQMQHGKSCKQPDRLPSQIKLWENQRH